MQLKNKFSILYFILFLLTLSSCTNFEDQSYDVIGLDKKNFGIVFSHNINGETHPCGCRHFPLGGLPQVAGLFHKLKKNEEIIYIDSGDTFFESFKIPELMAKSSAFNANELAKALSNVGLRYWVPGDQDFAYGLEFIKKVPEISKINILLANLKDKKLLKHKEWIEFEKGPHKIFILGVVDPQVIPPKYRDQFLAPEIAIKEKIKTLEKNGYKSTNPFHRLVVVSHSGIEADEKLAKAISQIDWIIGAHSMSFLKDPNKEGNTKIVQVLSRNHYMGHITFNMAKDKKEDSYQIHEVRDELKDELKPNSFLSFIDSHKEKLQKIQLEEQSLLVNQIGDNIQKIPTANTCLECHDKQYEFWQGTSHSIAYSTLVNAKEQFNSSCVKCHTLGFGDEKGFIKTTDVVQLKQKDEQKLKKYWQEFNELFSEVKSVRSLSSDKRKSYAIKWDTLDEKYVVSHNFANVQCQSCHVTHQEHPFKNFDKPLTSDEKSKQMKNKCLSCHDPDQSPSWYDKNEKGLSKNLNNSIFQQMWKKVSCPRGE